MLQLPTTARTHRDTRILARIGRCFWSSAVQVACYSPNSPLPVAFSSLPVMVLVPPGPCPPCAPAPALAALQVAPAEPIYRVHALAPLATQSQLASWALYQTFVSLSLCLLSLVPACLRPSHLFALWYMHLHHVRSLSTNWHLLGSDRDTKTKLGTNPSEPNHLVQSTWSQDRHSRELLALFTPRPRPAPSFSLCFGCAHLVFPWPPPSLFLFDCNARNYPFLTHTYPAVALHTRPQCLSLDTRCDVQPQHYSTLDHSPAQPERAALTTNGLEYRCRQPALLI